jgi:hypothetical protein
VKGEEGRPKEGVESQRVRGERPYVGESGGGRGVGENTRHVKINLGCEEADRG